MKVLIVLTSHDKLGDTGRKTGFWLLAMAPSSTDIERPVKTTSIARRRWSCGRPSRARERFMRPLSSPRPLRRFAVERCRRAVLMPQCWCMAERNIPEIKLLLIAPSAAATLAWSTKKMECIRTRRSRNSWWHVSRRRTACRAPLPKETLKAHVAATIRLGKRLMELRAASRNAETALLAVTTRKCSECTASWTTHEPAARWHVRYTFDDCRSGGSRRHVSDVTQPDIPADPDALR